MSRLPLSLPRLLLQRSQSQKGFAEEGEQGSLPLRGGSDLRDLRRGNGFPAPVVFAHKIAQRETQGGKYHDYDDDKLLAQQLHRRTVPLEISVAHKTSIRMAYLSHLRL